MAPDDAPTYRDMRGMVGTALALAGADTGNVNDLFARAQRGFKVTQAVMAHPSYRAEDRTVLCGNCGGAPPGVIATHRGGCTPATLTEGGELRCPNCKPGEPEDWFLWWFRGRQAPGADVPIAHTSMRAGHSA